MSSKSGELRQHEAGRRCKHEGCMTILSIYNNLDHCSLHTPIKKISPSDLMRNGRGAR